MARHAPLASLWLAFTLASVAAAQSSQETESPLAISLVTIGPGGAVWERFGHNMLRVRGGEEQLDRVWDWGRFSFDTERFFVRFAQGDLRYWMQGADGEGVVGWYANTGRTVAEQRLALSPAQAGQLLEFLRWNDTDEHRYYQYHYYNDNCSTRIRDALDAVLGGALRARTDTVVTRWSYREATKRLNQHNPILYFGLTTLLASSTDKKMTGWEEMFLPGGLAHWVRELTVIGPDGGTRPLVEAETVIAAGGSFPIPGEPSRWWPGFLVLGVLIGGLLTATGRSRSGARRLFLPAAVLYALGAGVLGLVMALLWVVSGHEVAWRNENLWQFNLVALALVPMLPAAMRGGGPRAGAALSLARIIVGCSVLGVLLKLLPVFNQANWDVIVLALPANVGLLLGVLGARSEK
ncbi:MAG: DUF4105 domain-containing protein [Gemmatimonadota bacterium]|nr:DUF4105 domain-containing protein [Gemmatimonadota bacterium]